MITLDHAYNHSYSTDVICMTYFITIMTIITTTMIITMIRMTIIPAIIATVLGPLDEGWVLPEVGVDVVITRYIYVIVI